MLNQFNDQQSFIDFHFETSVENNDVLENNNIAIWSYDVLSGCMMDCSPETKLIYGYPIDAFFR